VEGVVVVGQPLGHVELTARVPTSDVRVSVVCLFTNKYPAGNGVCTLVDVLMNHSFLLEFRRASERFTVRPVREYILYLYLYLRAVRIAATASLAALVLASAVRALRRRHGGPGCHAGAARSSSGSANTAAAAAAVEADAHEIVRGRLWLGAASAARDAAFITAVGVTHVVNCADEVCMRTTGNLYYTSYRCCACV
jgi:hypothetical protein